MNTKMYNSAIEGERDFSHYVLIRNYLAHTTQPLMSRQELQNLLSGFENIEKYRFEDDSETEHWMTVYAKFITLASAAAAIDTLNATGVVNAGFIQPVFDYYKEKEEEIGRCFRDVSLIAVQRKNLCVSYSFMQKFFEQYGKISRMSSGCTTIISYEYFSQALAAQVDNNRWSDQESFFSVTVIKQRKEILIAFLVALETCNSNMCLYPGYSPPEYPHVPLPEGPLSPCVTQCQGGCSDIAAEVIRILENRGIFDTDCGFSSGHSSCLPYYVSSTNLTAVSNETCNCFVSGGVGDGTEDPCDNAECNIASDQNAVPYECLPEAAAECRSNLPNGVCTDHFVTEPEGVEKWEAPQQTATNVCFNNLSRTEHISGHQCATPYYVPYPEASYSNCLVHNGESFLNVAWQHESVMKPPTNPIHPAIDENFKHEFLPNAKASFKGSFRTAERVSSNNSKQPTSSRNQDRNRTNRKNTRNGTSAKPKQAKTKSAKYNSV